ncbi:MAG TPA: hypothetical protein VGX28_13785 [Frankiaceae bacterium]|jgi:hypothetical protein|nr:hypothetical protein [Frankiaceae bacterium]
MGCYVCGTRQGDPARGASPWQRGVVRGVQVLGCPACQASGAWAAVLDACAACGSTALLRRLGETVCRACGHSGDGVAAEGVPPPAAASGALSDDVSAALERMFRQMP